MQDPKAQDEKKKANTMKCVAVGDAAVGKTCLLMVYTTKEFPGEYIPTVFDNYETEVDINGDMYTFQFWDTAGAETYDVLRPLAYGSTDVFLIVYSVVDRDSFDNVKNKWAKDIKNEQGGTPFILVGNKVDLRKNAREGTFVSNAEGKKLKKDVEAADIFEVSAFLNDGLTETFEAAMRTAFDNLQKRHSSPEKDDDGGGCCTVV